MLQEIKQYKTADLVLNVSGNFDPAKLNLGAWGRYIDLLIDNRKYQKEAIHKSIIYLASGLYGNINDLVKENWANPKMVELKNRYQNINEYEHELQIPNKLSATIDLATGTGKSYVIYGIAQIMLSMGLVDNVLVLCPSLTIKEGLTTKFNTLASDSLLLKAIPDECIIKNPSVKEADVTIKHGDICIENIHSAYLRSGTSIKASFSGRGDRTLVLNDEAHHIYNPIESRDNDVQALKRWKEFLINPEYNFKYILGFTGTAYIKDDYFNDVIFRYSLRQAVDDKIVKMVDYVSNNDDAEDEIKFQEIFDNHQANINTYRKSKPLTILVTKDITKAKQLASDLSEFLENKKHYSSKECEEKILIVSSANEHKLNLKKLKDVDNKDDKVEWIVSVSMLTEGWDVKNVFQIVPWEDRAFNSKLLIAQVLGRGLRIPPEYQKPQPRVRVFNHDAWSKNIKGLVDDILEAELKLTSSPVIDNERAKYHFQLHHINYKKEPTEKETKKTNQEFDYTKGFIELQSQLEESEKETEYTSLSGDVSTKNTLIQYNTYSIDEIVTKIYNELKLREWEGTILKLPTGKYSKDKLPPKCEIKSIIRNSMNKVGILGDRLIEKNKIKIESSFNTLLRKSGKTTIYQKVSQEPFIVDTSKMEKETISVSNLRHNSTVFYSSNYGKELCNEAKEILNGVIEDESFPKSSSKEINVYNFKTPIDLVFAKYDPERKFISLLCKAENAQKIEGWIKSRDVSFYSVEYSITSVGGKHSKVQSFNPDFFIKIKADDVIHYIVIESKTDDDITDENKAKKKYAKQHFEVLNQELKTRNINEVYHFYFISPVSYGVFFDHLNNGLLLQDKFKSDLEAKLDEEE